MFPLIHICSPYHSQQSCPSPPWNSYFLQDQSLVYLAVGFVDPFLLNLVWVRNYMPNIEKNVKKETDFNFKLQRSSDSKNVVKMMKTALTDGLLFLGTMFGVMAVREGTCQF